MSAAGRRIGRSLAAIGAGFVSVVALSLGTDAALHASGVYPGWGEPMAGRLFVLATMYRVAYAIGGSYLAARLALNRPMAHAMALGCLGLLASIAGAAATWNAGPAFGPRWYPLALVATALPCAWLGGKLHAPRRP
jgi:peptidoglycan/LPS O-acetylase OafA/YrhL